MFICPANIFKIHPDMLIRVFLFVSVLSLIQYSCINKVSNNTPVESTENAVVEITAQDTTVQDSTKGEVYQDELSGTYDTLINYTEAVTITDDDETEGYCEGYYTQAADLYKNGEYESAIQQCSKCLELDPTKGIVWTLRGASKDQLGNKDGACSDWRKAISLGFSAAEQFIEGNCN